MGAISQKANKNQQLTIKYQIDYTSSSLAECVLVNVNFKILPFDSNVNFIEKMAF